MIPEAPAAQPATAAEAEQLARSLYGLQAEAHRLPGEYDDNFHLKTAAGEEFVLKVMHPGRTREFIDLQCAALRHLAKHAPELTLPRVCLTLEKEPFHLSRTGDGTERFVWLLTFIPGKIFAAAKPHSPALLRELGGFLGKMDQALASFSHPGALRELKWELARSLWAREHLAKIVQETRRALAGKFFDLFEHEVLPEIPKLRKSAIYGDANDHNILVRVEPGQGLRIASAIDFGDMHEGATCSELAIGMAYAILGKQEVLEAAAGVVSGYHAEFPLTETELRLLYAMTGTRLAVSVANSAMRKELKPGDEYVTISEEPAWVALERWERIHPRFAWYTFRAACGLEPVPDAPHVREFLKKSRLHAASILKAGFRREVCVVLDLSAGSKFLGADPANAGQARLTEAILRRIKEAGARTGIGRYDEARPLYPAEQFSKSKNPTDERRTIHLGLDLFAEAGTALHAPVEGTVHLLANNAADGDYGPLVILRHETQDGREFFTLYGHLTAESVANLRTGQRIGRDEVFAKIGAPPENGNWPPHVHFQVIVDLLELGRDFPGVGFASQRNVWKSLSPDPNLLAGIPQECFPAAEATPEESLESRRRLLGKNLSVSYRKPLKIVRGWRQYLYDDTGRAYLDVYNNVPLVGHSHPRVARAVQEQMALLNTNTRYVHDNVLRYAERLTQLLPESLRVCYFLNSGSEANELALRLARTHTKSDEVIALEHAYHGHTGTLIDISHYKFAGPGGAGKKPWVSVVPIADDYRGRYRRGDPEAGRKYAAHVAELVEAMRREGKRPGTFIAETLPSVAGQIVFPEGYLAEAYGHVRAAGGVCIADEVQAGFGRLGKHFWGFETQSVAPDIVVLGKPIGNAFPLAAVVTTEEIAGSFANGMEFFSTFGGNPVACAAGLAVLDALEEEGLQENARRVGEYLLARLAELQTRFPLIGDVRGMGLFLGLDLVTDRETREPASLQAAYTADRLRERGVLTGTDGPHHNVIKLRPPLIFSREDADLFLTTLEEVLEEDAAQP